MRCNHCNIDLASDAKTCPLCGMTASDDANVLTDLHDAPYPSYENVVPEKVQKKKPNPHWLRAGLIISAVCMLTGQGDLWTKLSPFCLIAVAIIYLCYGLKEKGTLMHASVALVTSFLVQVVYFLYALIYHLTLQQILFSMIVTLVMLLILYLKYPERVEAQMAATFHI